MNCQDAYKLLHEYIDDSLPLDSDRPLQRHLAMCGGCAEHLVRLRTLIDELRSLPRAEPAADLQQRIMAGRAGLERRPVQQRWFVGAAALAAAVSAIAILLGYAHWVRQAPVFVEQASAATRQVNFLVRSQRPLEGVRFTLEMPQHITLRGYAKRHKLRWRGRLQKGENLLQLPVIVTDSQPAVLVLRIEHGDGMKELKVRLNLQT